MMRPWKAWVAAVSVPMDARILAMVRILAASCVVFDLARVGLLGLADDFFLPYVLGGISQIHDSALVVDVLFGDATGPVLYGVSLAAMSLVALGIGGRPVQLLAILAYAQLGHLNPPGDRGVDRILRTTLLALLFSNAHRVWALGPWLRKKASPATVSSAVPWFLRFFLVDVYLSAGISKLMATPQWLDYRSHPVLYRILSDPMAGRLDPVAAEALTPLWNAGGWFTIVMELGSVLIVTRLAPWWAVAGIGMHLGIAATMHLGMFSWGMLALYPVLLAPWLGPRLAKLSSDRRRPRATATPSSTSSVPQDSAAGTSATRHDGR